MNVEKMRRQVARAGPVDAGDPVQTFIEHVARIERQTRAQRSDDLGRTIQAFWEGRKVQPREDEVVAPPRKRSWLPW